ncbi:hypothetical protein [Micromonospora haikouensis]|uniref:hypothetical protein n=1 Tax=Micromonospora haikouensis TaxID=686309 RepID=UPI00118730DA|nr:hypothetical protein [Micromonospora haikouensis]
MGQQRGEFGCACRMVMADPGNSSDEVLGEVGVAVPVLRGEAGAGGVAQDDAEPVVFVAWCGGVVVVDDESGEELPVGPTADAGLGWMDSKPLVAGDVGDVGDQVVDAAWGEVAGEAEVVGVPAVGDLEGIGEAGEASVKSVGGQVRQRWARSVRLVAGGRFAGRRAAPPAPVGRWVRRRPAGGVRVVQRPVRVWATGSG